MEQFSIGANFKGATARRNEGERFDAFAEFKNFGRQTDGLWRVVSNDAIFDRDFRLHPVCSFPTKMVRKSWEAVKMRAVRHPREACVRKERLDERGKEKRSRVSDFRDRPSNPFPNAP
jgi:hypothetical protein